MRKLRRILAFVLGLLVVAGIVGGIKAYQVLSSFRTEGVSMGEVWQGITNPRGLFPGQDRITLLLLGQDYNRDRKGIAYTKNSRADTIMLMSVDLENKAISAVSIPRDTFIEGADGKRGKINATFARGGVELIKATIEKQFAITIDNYLVVKPDAVKEIVDAVGGIHVETIDKMKYDDSWGDLHVDLPKGRQHINGEQAVGFVRFREVNRYRMSERGRMIPIRGVESSKEEGDIRRTARQQQFVQALIAAANTPGNLWKADKIVDIGFGQVETNLRRTQVLALATIFKGSGTGNMKSATLPGDDDSSGEAYYYRLDEPRARAMVDWLIKHDGASYRSLTRVVVKNGSGKPGAARIAAEWLDDEGFQASSGGNSRETADATTVQFRIAAFEDAARLVAKRLGVSTVSKIADADPRETWKPEVEVVIGKDIVDSILGQSP